MYHFLPYESYVRTQCLMQFNMQWRNILPIILLSMTQSQAHYNNIRCITFHNETFSLRKK